MMRRHVDTLSRQAITGHSNGETNSCNNSVRIEISPQALARIIKNRALAVADIHCLDDNSKHWVWQTCLEASTRNA